MDEAIVNGWLFFRYLIIGGMLYSVVLVAFQTGALWHTYESQLVFGFWEEKA